MLMLLALLTSAHAADPETDRSSIGFGFRGVVESWDDPALGDVYRTGMLAPGIAGVVPLFSGLKLEVEVAYRRMKPRDETVDARLEMLPTVALLEMDLIHRSFGDVYLGAGPALTAFTERHPGNVSDTSTAVLRGLRGAGELRAGVRLDTGLVRPWDIPDMQTGVKRLELDVSVGRRVALPADTGFQLGAWRMHVGVLARL